MLKKFSTLATAAVAVLALTVVGGVIARTAFADDTPGAAAGSDTTPKKPRIHGVVTAVSATSISIHNRKEDTDSTFTVTPDTKVKVDGEDSTIDKVTVGMHVGIKSEDGKTALAIGAKTPKPKGEGGGEAAAE